MKSQFRRILGAVSAVGVTLFPVTQIGPTLIAPGTNTSFDPNLAAEESPHRFFMRHDKGDVACWVLLALSRRVDGELKLYMNGDVTPVAVVADTFHGAAVSVEGGFHIEISKSGHQDAFKWTTGRPLMLELADSSPDPIEIVDWEVYPSNGSHDSKARARRREQWFYLSLTALVLSVAGGVLAAWPQEEQGKPLTAETCIASLIQRIEGRSRTETRRMHNFLTKVLIYGTDVSLALQSVGLRDRAGKLAFLVSVHKRFTDQVDELIEGLARYRDKLEPPGGRPPAKVYLLDGG